MAQSRAASGTNFSMSWARLASRRKGSSPRRSRAGTGLPLLRRARRSSWEMRGMRDFTWICCGREREEGLNTEGTEEGLGAPFRRMAFPGRRARRNGQRGTNKNFPQGLKPRCRNELMSELKLRPPKLEVLGDGGDQAGGEIAGEAVEGGILFGEEAFNVCGDFVFVAEDEIVSVVENFLRVGLR